MEYVVKERYNGEWRNTFLRKREVAKRLCNRIIARGGSAVWMRNAA